MKEKNPDTRSLLQCWWLARDVARVLSRCRGIVVFFFFVFIFNEYTVKVLEENKI